MISCTSNGCLASRDTMPSSSSGSNAGGSGSARRTAPSPSRRAPEAAPPAAFSEPTMSRASANACASSSARWSATPDRRVWVSPPPSSSALTSSPVAAFTSGGPARKIVPCSRTMIVWSDIAGT